MSRGKFANIDKIYKNEEEFLESEESSLNSTFIEPDPQLNEEPE